MLSIHGEAMPSDIIMGGKIARCAPATSTRQVSAKDDFLPICSRLSYIDKDSDPGHIDKDSYMRSVGLIPKRTRAHYSVPNVLHRERCYPTKFHFLTTSYFEGNMRTSLFDADITSDLGQLLTFNFQISNTPSADYDQLIMKNERHCCVDVSSVQRLRDRIQSNFPVTFVVPKHSNKRSNHRYCFTKAQKKEHLKTLRTGLDKQSRMLKRLCRPCSVMLKRIKYVPWDVALDSSLSCSVRLIRLPGFPQPHPDHWSSSPSLQTLNHQGKPETITTVLNLCSNQMVGREIEMDGHPVIDLCSDDDTSIHSSLDENIPSSVPCSKSVFNVLRFTGGVNPCRFCDASLAQHLESVDFPNTDAVSTYILSGVQKSNHHNIKLQHNRSQVICNVVLENVENMIQESRNGTAYVKGTHIKVPQCSLPVAHYRLAELPNRDLAKDSVLSDVRKDSEQFHPHDAVSNVAKEVTSVRAGICAFDCKKQTVGSYPERVPIHSRTFLHKCEHPGVDCLFSCFNHCRRSCINPSFCRKQNGNHPLKNSNRMMNVDTPTSNIKPLQTTICHSGRHGDGVSCQPSHRVAKVVKRQVPFFEHVSNGDVASKQFNMPHRADFKRHRSQSLIASKLPGRKRFSTKSNGHVMKNKHETSGTKNFVPNTLKISVKSLQSVKRSCFGVNGDVEIFPIIFKCMLCSSAMALHKNFHDVISKHIINQHGGFDNVTILKQVMKNSKYTLIKITSVK